MSETGLPVSDRDRHHFLRLKDDLWHAEGSRVSLMVGAGLSKHARPLLSESRPFPTGRELADVMRIQLPSQSDFQGDRAARSAEATPSPARIASEYEAEFCRRSLDDVIRKHVPNDEYEPGPLHEALLRLPWRDVFTTNYDTLLERTTVPERRYHVVVSEKDLSHWNSTRIIKLHGSFAGGAGLISTEDDYRTYPTDFPLFVNTVRQALIENTLVLVGFSGEDLNFQSWTGWIRDKLGKDRPSIYLIVPPGRKVSSIPLLNQRGVTPIVLSEVSGINAIGQTPTGAALLHFARSLSKITRSKTPHRVEEWPIEVSGDTVDGPSFSNEASDLDAKIERAVQRWTSERESYPGWLIAPATKRQLLWQTTKRWVEPVLEASENWSPADAVVALSELNWRLEVAMVPLFAHWCGKIAAATERMLKTVERRSEASRGPNTGENDSSPTWSADEAWVRLVLALAREARDDHEDEQWRSYMKSLSGVVERFPNLVDRYHYECVLWKLARIDRGGALAILEKWEPAEDALRARMWKAGMLAEVGRLAETHESLRDLLPQIRKTTGRDGQRSVEMRSLEGWCTYLLFSVEVSLDFKRHKALREKYAGRWRELRKVDCDPWTVNDYFTSALNRKPPQMPQNVRSRRAFDPGRRHVVRSLGGGGIGPWLPAFACIRWFEEVGIPVRGRRLARLGREPLVAACRWVAPFYTFRGISVLVRAGAAKELREAGLMDRPQVAEMDGKVATQLNEIMLAAAEREVGPLRRDDRPWYDAGVLEAVAEVLSRVTVRLDRKELSSSFRVALALYGELRSVSVHGLGAVMSAWFQRLYEAADDRLLRRWLPALLRAPLRTGREAGASGFWQDPLAGFPLYLLRGWGAVTGRTRDAIRDAVTQLLARGGQVEMGRQRKDVAWRVSGAFRIDLLTERQKEQFAGLLWAGVKKGQLPVWDGLWVWDYVTLAPVGRDDALERIKSELLRRMPIGETKADGTTTDTVIETNYRRLWEVGAATKGIVEMPYEPSGVVEWTADERNLLWRGLQAWWWERRTEMIIEETAPVSDVGDQIRNGAADLERCLVRLKVATMAPSDASARTEVDAFVDYTRKQGVELGGALPYLLIGRPKEKSQVAVRLTEDLRCGDARRAMAAARGVWHWIYLAEAGKVARVPRVVVDALVDRVAFRILAGAQDCIRALAAVLVEKGSVLSREAVQRLVSSLHGWEKAVQQVAEDTEPDGIPQDERPDLRASVGVLVNALNVWCAKNRARRQPSEIITRLRAKYQEDPLPEVRRAVSDGRWRYW